MPCLSCIKACIKACILIYIEAATIAYLFDHKLKISFIN